ncbi:FAD-binding protein [Yinghuangia sp. YIM S09857]|uniref:FAD-binding protein n=1 Tax=Yinghuangia sp. YIM S09857 TaxID=3436929 RepID=UPI003F530703
MGNSTGRGVSRRGVSRRGFFAAAAAGVGVVGYNATVGRWVTTAEAADMPFSRVPRLDGALVMDDSTRVANSTDAGHMTARVPHAVLFPASAEDVRVMVRYCAARRIPVATNTGRNSVFGQTLVSGGLVVNAKSLDTIHSISSAGADVDAGVQWYDLIGAAFRQGLTPASITGYTQLGVAGTLSIGGLGVATTNLAVPQAAMVKKMQVVTGAGDLVVCSRTRNSGLFKAMLAGQGQCGVITRVTIDLVPAPRYARVYRSAPYPDVASCVHDLRTLAERSGQPDGFSSVTSANNPGVTGALPLNLLGAVFHDDPAAVPSTAVLTRGCSPTAQQAQYVDMGYLDYVYLVDSQVNAWKAAGNWDGLVKPWFNALIPDNRMLEWSESIFPGLTDEDVSPTTFVVVSPTLTSAYTDDFPLFRAPSPEGGRWSWLCGILTNSATPDPGSDYATRILERNHTWWKRAHALGGTRYVEDAIPFTKSDWCAHYGATHPQFAAWKRQFDPAGIMTPGAGIF